MNEANETDSLGMRAHPILHDGPVEFRPVPCQRPIVA